MGDSTHHIKRSIVLSKLHRFWPRWNPIDLFLSKVRLVWLKFPWLRFLEEGDPLRELATVILLTRIFLLKHLAVSTIACLLIRCAPGTLS